MAVYNYGVVDLWVVFEEKVQVFLEEVDPGVGVERAQKDGVGVLEFFYTEVPGIADGEAVGYEFWQSREAIGDVEIDDAGVSLGSEVLDVTGVDAGDGGGFGNIGTADVVPEVNRMAGEVLQDSKTAVGGDDEGLTISAEDL